MRLSLPIGLVVASWLLSLPACMSNLPSDNPYDPEAPADQKAKASVTGVVRGDPLDGSEPALLSGATVILAGPTTPANSPATTATDGAFVFNDLVPGIYSLELSHAGHFPHGRDMILEAGEQRQLEITLVSIPQINGADNAHLTGTIQKAGELVLPAAEQDHSGITVEVAGASVRTTTNAFGTFDLFLAPGSYDIGLNAPDYRPQTIAGVTTSVATTTTLPGSPIVLDPNPGRISGAVTLEGESAGNYAGTTVQVLGSETGTTAADGSFLINDVPPGAHTVQITRPDYATQSLVGVVVRGGREAVLPGVELLLARGSIIGVAELDGESDHGGIVIELTGESFAAITASSGAFVVTGVPVGTYELTARKPGWLAESVAAVTVDANSETNIGTLTLAPNPGSVTGRVTLEGAGVYDGTTVSLLPGGYATVTAGDGSFTITGVLAGTYTLTASRAGYKDGSTVVAVAAGLPTTAPTIELIVPRGHIQGVIQVENGGPADLEAVRVDLIGPVTTSSFVQTSGAYGFSDIPIGTYSVIARLTGHSNARADGIVVTEGNTETLPVLLLRESTGDFLINGGSFYATDPLVTLTLDNATAVDMRVSEDSTFTNASSGHTAYVPYASGPQHSLSAGDGEKTIFVQYRDGLGAESAVYSSMITLDTTAPFNPSISINDGATHTKSTSLTLTLSAEDATSGVTWVKISEDTDFSDDGWRAFAPALFYPLSRPAPPGGDGTVTLYVLFKDEAGVETLPADEAHDDIELDRVAPALTGLTIDCNGATDPSHCNTPLVTISITPTTNEPTASLALSNTGSFGGATFSAFVPSTSWMLSANDGQKTVSVQLRDAAGNATSGTDNDTVVLDTIAPTLTMSLSGPGLGGPSSILINDSSVSVTLDGVDETTAEIDLDMMISNYPDFTDDFRVPLDWIPYVDLTLVHLLVNPAASGSKRVWAKVRDLAGNETEVDATIEVDLGDPVLSAAVFVEGSVTRQVDVTLQIDVTGADELAVTGPVTGSGTWVPAAPFLPVTLTGGDGLKSVQIDARDASGRTDGPVPAAITLDTSVPTGISVTIEGTVAGGVPSWILTGTTQVTLTLVCNDASEVKLSNNATVADGVWQPCTTDPIAWQLLPGDSVNKKVYGVFRDPAGNPSGVEEGVIELDTTPPPPGSLTLAGGAEYSRDPSVSIGVGSTETVWSVSISGDIADVEEGIYTSAGVPANVTLTDPDGTKTVSATIIDEAGNLAAPVTEIIRLDRIAPDAGTVVLAGGQTTVAGDIISVVISDTAPDEMMLWEVAGSTACGDYPCTDPGFVLFAPSTTFTLSTAGDRRVCWKFCDAAGNDSVVGFDDITLTASAPRPRPIVTSISPMSHIALSNEGGGDPRYPLDINGRGIAYDTLAEIGNFLLPCTSSGATNCEPDSDDDGCEDAATCGASCECLATCAETCRVDLPDTIMRNVGTYVVRLITPDPVVGGIGTSQETRFLSVVAPLPSISRIWRRGVTQTVDAGVPDAQDLTIEVWGEGFMDNVQFRLGPNYGEVVDFQETGVDPPTRYARVDVSTKGLFPSDLVDVEFIAINPSPGGGQVATPFGINPVTVYCTIWEPSCESNLRGTRALGPDGRTLLQNYEYDTALDSGLVWRGGTAARLYDTSGDLLTRVSASSGHGTLPVLALARGALATATFEDSRGDQPHLSLTPGGARGTGQIGPASFIATAPGARGMAMGDWDEDGRPDLAVTNGAADTVSVLRNLPGGGFEVAAQLSTPSQPWAVAAADVNGDGHADILSSSNGGLSVRLGNGDGTFGDRADFFGASLPGMAVGDLDEDTHPDVVISGSFIRGRGDGTFESPAGFGLGILRDVRLADMNDDGHLDVVAFKQGVGPLVALGAGDGTITTSNVYASGAGDQLAVGDLDMDGALDVVIETSSGTGVFMGDGTGALAPHPTVPVDPSDGNPVLADLNGDGILDLATCWSINGGEVHAAMGAGDGTFAAATTIDSADAYRLLAGDVNGDGAPDLMTSATTDGGINLHLSSTWGTSGSFVDVISQHAAWTINPADIDKDGFPDMVITSWYNDDASLTHVKVAYGDGQGSFPDIDSLPQSGGSIRRAAILDLDGNGLPDIVKADSSSEVLVRLQAPIGTFGADIAFATADDPWWLATGDFNNDSIPDVALPCEDVDLVSVLLGTGAGPGWFGPKSDIAVGLTPRGVAVGDLDLDGNHDLLVHNAGNNSVTVLLGNGAGGFAEPAGSPYPTFSTASSPNNMRRWFMTIGDFDNDGIEDALASDYNGAYLMLGNGDGTLDPAQLVDIGSYEYVVEVGDIDGDGNLDIWAAVGNDRFVGIRRGDGLGGFEPTVALEVKGREIIHAPAADFNEDGALDLALSSYDVSLASARLMPSPFVWTQELTDMPAASVSAPASVVTTLDVHQARQYVSDVAVRAILNGADYTGVSIALITPQGTSTPLDTGATWPGGTRWTGHYTVDTTPALSASSQTWQPAGNWSLEVTGGNSDVQIEDFAVLTMGQFVLAPPGREPARPAPLRLVSGKRFAVVHGTTLGSSNSGDAACSDAAGSGADLWYELTLPVDNDVRARLVSAVDHVLEIRSGPCAVSTSEACDRDSGYGQNPIIAGYVSLAAGTHCILVDGWYDGGDQNEGDFDLWVELLNPI